MDIINLYENYNSYFKADLKAIFERCSKIASKNKVKIYLIGGLVRDLMLGRENYDIDITVEGDAIKFAKILEKEIGAKILSLHKPFGTAKVEINGIKVDFASTRSELYPKKGHLPKVNEIGCSLEKDVLRRDFTVNSLALSLNQQNFAQGLDYVGGFKDLKNKKIRILHDKSFIDDPTRIIRALKYAQRLSFELDKKTFELQKEYLKKINYDMCYKRVKNELKLTFNSKSQNAFETFIEQGIYKLITKKGIELPKINIEKLIAKYRIKHSWIVYVGLIGVFEEDSFSDKLELTKKEKETISASKKLLKLKIKKDDFGIYKAFEGKCIESLIIYYLISCDEKVLRYLDVLRGIKINIKGQDLIAIGLKPSKEFSQIFDYVLREKLKNSKINKAKEIELVRGFCNY